MSVIDDAVRANQDYVRDFAHWGLSHHPARHLAVVACMDCRISVERALGLSPGDAHIIRNAGGIVTEDVLRSLILSHHCLGTQEFMIINHTECGLAAVREDEFRDELQRKLGTDCVVPASFHAFSDVEANLRRQVQKVRTHPWLPRSIVVRGFIYDVRSGQLSELDTAMAAAG